MSLIFLHLYCHSLPICTSLTSLKGVVTLLLTMGDSQTCLSVICLSAFDLFCPTFPEYCPVQRKRMQGEPYFLQQVQARERIEIARLYQLHNSALSRPYQVWWQEVLEGSRVFCRKAWRNPLTGIVPSVITDPDFRNTHSIMGFCWIDHQTNAVWYCIWKKTNDSDSFLDDVLDAIIEVFLVGGDIMQLFTSAGRMILWQIGCRTGIGLFLFFCLLVYQSWTQLNCCGIILSKNWSITLCGFFIIICKV